MRLGAGLVIALALAGCIHDGLKLQADACTRVDNPDPDACLAVARNRFAAHDANAARDYLELFRDAFQGDPACLKDHSAAACFHGVVAVLHEPGVGLLAEYAIEPALLELLPPWTGSDRAGPHVQARTALEAMCTKGGDPIAQQRACLVLGDLVLLERTKQIAGWDDALDGYAAACKISLAPADPAAAAFERLVVRTYEVPDACAVGAAATRGVLVGSSIFDARNIIARTRQEAAQHEASLQAAAAREADRVVAMRQQEAEAAAQAAREVATTSDRQIVAATVAEDWDLLLDTLRARTGKAPLDDTAASALAHAWDPFIGWLVSGSTVVGAQIELARDLDGLVPAGHALSTRQATLRDRAVAEAKRLATTAGGPGGRFLHAALQAQASGAGRDADAARRLYAELAKVRATLVLDGLPATCALLARSLPARAGHDVHATAALACTIEPEHAWTQQETYMVNGSATPTDVGHRGFKLIVHGTITMAGQVIPVDIDDIVDEATDKLDRPFTTALAPVIDGIWSQTIAPLDTTTAADALAAGQKALAQHNLKRAENELAIHATIAGASEELDKLLTPYHVTFAQLVPTP